MARLFDDASTEYLQRSGAVVTAEPCTMAGWINTDNAGTWQNVFGVFDESASNVYLTVYIGGDDLFVASNDGGGEENAKIQNLLFDNTWHHVCGVWTSDASRAAFLDGGNKATNSDSSSPANLDVTVIGRTADSTPSLYFSGMIAEVGFWNVALTDAEVAILAEGYSPLLVRPESLVAYWPLIRDTDDDIVGGYSMTAFNTPTIAAHPRVIYPGLIYLGVPAAAAPPARIPRPTAAYYGGPTIF